MESKAEDESKNVPAKVKIAIRKPTLVVLPDGNSGLRINTVTDTIEAFPKDTARMRQKSEAVLDSIRKKYE